MCRPAPRCSLCAKGSRGAHHGWEPLVLGRHGGVLGSETQQVVSALSLTFSGVCQDDQSPRVVSESQTVCTLGIIEANSVVPRGGGQRSHLPEATQQVKVPVGTLLTWVPVSVAPSTGASISLGHTSSCRQTHKARTSDSGRSETECGAGCPAFWSEGARGWGNIPLRRPSP